MKILISDYGGHPFPFELSQHLSKKYKVVHSYAQYFETPKANFNEKYDLSNEVLNFLASEISASTREMIGGLNGILAFSKVNLRSPSIYECKKIL